jgi:putative ABC transport system permease protein
MNLQSIALNNLRRRKAKMAFLTIGLSVGIATIVTLVTLTRSMSGDIERKMEEFGANILITPSSNGLYMNYGGISLGGVSFDQREILEKDLAKIKTIENHKNISAISPKVLGGIKIGSHELLLAGVDFPSELKMKQWWRVFGAPPQKDDEILAGSETAKVLDLESGSTLVIKGETFKVSGILEQTGSQDDALIFAALPRAQKLLGKEGKITIAEVAALCSGCPISDMVTQIAEKLPDAKVSAIQQVVAGRLKTLDQFKRFSMGIAAVVLFIGSLIVLVTMMGSVAERKSEIGVFRAIGFRKSHIMKIILTEAALVSFVAGILGYGSGLLAARIVLPFMAESKSVHLVTDAWTGAAALLLALLLGVIASIYPARQAARLDPTEALRAL